MDRSCIKRFLLLTATSLFIAGTMSANVITYQGQDDGAPTTGPFPNSTAAFTSFAAAASALSPLGTITFENQPVGFQTNFTAAPGVTVTLNAPNFGEGFSGISNTTLGNLYGFNTTPGGSNWLGFPGGSATFSFASPTDYFGFWLTGVQTVFTSAITVNFNDGTSQTLDAPVNVNGGAAFFGFTDAGESIASVTISNISGDAWGIDDVNYNTAVTSLPDPSSIMLLGTCVLGSAGLLRRRRMRAKASELVP